MKVTEKEKISLIKTYILVFIMSRLDRNNVLCYKSCKNKIYFNRNVSWYVLTELSN